MFYLVQHFDKGTRKRGLNRFIVKYNSISCTSFVINSESLYAALCGNTLV